VFQPLKAAAASVFSSSAGPAVEMPGGSGPKVQTVTVLTGTYTVNKLQKVNAISVQVLIKG
jgi:hypothetical protein